MPRNLELESGTNPEVDEARIGSEILGSAEGVGCFFDHGNLLARLTDFVDDTVPVETAVENEDELTEDPFGDKADREPETDRFGEFGALL